MTEAHVVKNCAPTLAGLKTGNIFGCPCESEAALLESVRDLNRKLSHKGLRAVPLRFSQKKAMVYVYRPGKLTEDLSHGTAAEILAKQGYEPGSCSRCIAQLRRRLQEQEEFPHEIGLFLGYPPEDVCGFMEHKGDCCKCVGCWKVYGDESAAKKRFAQFKKCTRVYCDQFEKGRPIERLTVAC